MESCFTDGAAARQGRAREGRRAETESQRSQPSQAARPYMVKPGWPPAWRRDGERREDGWGTFRDQRTGCAAQSEQERAAGAKTAPAAPRLRQAAGAGLGSWGPHRPPALGSDRREGARLGPGRRHGLRSGRREEQGWAEAGGLPGLDQRVEGVLLTICVSLGSRKRGLELESEGVGRVWGTKV